jgi:hypothetical protein
MGGTEKVVETVGKLAESPWHEIGTLSFTCTPMVIGDDVTAALRSYSERTNRPMIYSQEERGDPGRPVIRLLLEEFAKAESDPPERDPLCFNLVGYPTGILEDEITFLRSLGLRKNVQLLPDIYLPHCRDFLKAEVQVVDSKQYLRPFLQQVFEGLPLQMLKLSPPLGRRGTREWCRTIASRFGRGEEFEDRWAEFEEPFREKWEKLCREAERYRLGFILDGRELEDFRSGALFQNIPIFDALCEMGFGVDVYVYSGKGKAQKSGTVTVKRPAGSDKVVLGYFSNPRELELAITTSQASAFYSEYYYDWRLTGCGKAGFSFHDLEYGLGGAVRNLKYLLSLCKMSFYRRYSRFLRHSDRWDALHEE